MLREVRFRVNLVIIKVIVDVFVNHVLSDSGMLPIRLGCNDN